MYKSSNKLLATFIMRNRNNRNDDALELQVDRVLRQLDIAYALGLEDELRSGNQEVLQHIEVVRLRMEDNEALDEARSGNQEALQQNNNGNDNNNNDNNDASNDHSIFILNGCNGHTAYDDSANLPEVEIRCPHTEARRISATIRLREIAANDIQRIQRQHIDETRRTQIYIMLR